MDMAHEIPPTHLAETSRVLVCSARAAIQNAATALETSAQRIADSQKRITSSDALLQALNRCLIGHSRQAASGALV